MAIELQEVVRRVGEEIHIFSTSLALEEGIFNVLLGTTLSGKTTLMRLMAGLEVPSSGRVLFRGKDVTGVPARKRNVSMVYQQFINYPSLSVFENIASPLRVSGCPKAEVERRVTDVAEMLGLVPMLGRRPSELSGGQQQRTALARALVKDSSLILLDEPLANLDYKLREELREELPEILRKRGATVVYATSEPQEALLLGGCTATLHEGRVTQFGPTLDVYRRPNDLVSAQVFADPPLNTAAALKQGLVFALEDCDVCWPAVGAAAGLPDGGYTVGLRPYHITPSRADGDALEVRGRVLLAELSGSESIVHVEIGGRAWVSQFHGVHALAVGVEEAMYVQTDRFFYFGENGALLAP